MSDEIRTVITRAIQSARINGQRARIEGEYLDIIGCRILEDLHAAGYIEPDWSSEMDAAPRDGTPIQAKIPGHGSDNIIAWSKEYPGWHFVEDQEPPDDWTDGVCWGLNAEGNKSTEPTHWKPITAPESGE